MRCMIAVSWYPTGFLAVIVAAGVVTGVMALLFGHSAKPYATFLVVRVSD